MRNKITPYLFTLYLLASSPFVLGDRISQPALQQSGLEKTLLLTIEKAGARLIAAGEHGSIIYSDDGGKVWHQAKVPTSVLITDMHFFDNQIGWAVGHDGIVLGSQDGGENWARLLEGVVLNELRANAIKSALAVLQSQPDADAELLESMEYQLDDAQVALEEGPSTPLLDVYFLDDQVGYVLGAYGLFLKTEDGGRNWAYEGHMLPNPENFHLNKMHKSKNGNLLILGEAGLLLESADLGTSWHVVETPYQGSFFSIAESDGLYLMGLRGTVLKRTLNNTSESQWKEINIGVTATINDAVIVDGRAYLVGQGGVLLRQEGEGFQTFTKRGLRSFSGIEVFNRTLVTVGEGGVGRVALEEGAK